MSVAASIAHVTTIPESLKLLLLDQLLAIRGAGYEVAGVSAPGTAIAELERAAIRHLPVPFVRASGLTPLADARATASLIRLFRRERFTIVHTHTAKPDLFGAIAARLARVPIVVTTLHGFYFHDLMPPRTRRMYVELARVGMRMADAVLSQNPEDVETAVRENICPPDKIQFLGNGIDLRRFDRDRVGAEAARLYRAELGIPADVCVIGFVGRLVQDKGIRELFQAVQSIREREPRIRIVLVGMTDRAKRDVIEPRTAEQFGIADLCHFLGHRDDMPELYACMDVLVLPSYREGFPRAIMEASAMSVPVVATNVRGCRTAVTEGENGLLVGLGDIAALARAIEDLVADPAKRRRMGARGREIAIAQFDQERVFRKVLDTYERLLATRH